MGVTKINSIIAVCQFFNTKITHALPCSTIVQNCLFIISFFFFSCDLCIWSLRIYNEFLSFSFHINALRCTPRSRSPYDKTRCNNNARASRTHSNLKAIDLAYTRFTYNADKYTPARIVAIFRHKWILKAIYEDLFTFFRLNPFFISISFHFATNLFVGYETRRGIAMNHTNYHRTFVDRRPTNRNANHVSSYVRFKSCTRIVPNHSRLFL